MDLEELTLHVGAGTFKPVNSEEIEGHEMHTEWISVRKATIESLINHGGKAIAVGTTSVRTLESLYHMGVTLMLNPEATDEQLKVKQWQPYELPSEVQGITSVEALQALLDYMNKNADATFMYEGSIEFEGSEVLDRIELIESPEF